MDAGAGADASPNGPGLADLLALLGPAGELSAWTCEEVEAVGPLAADLRQMAGSGPLPGTHLAELAAGITHTLGGVFEATRPGDDGPWLALHIADGGCLQVATRSRALLDDLRRRFPEAPQ